MGQRLDLQLLLEAIAPNVYFQPPPNVKMLYPCIKYERDDAEIAFADNVAYRSTKRYKVTVIDRDPDSLIPDQLCDIPLCAFDRFYTVDGLNHDVFNLFF